MRTRCPCCGASLSLDVLVEHEQARDALKAAFALSGDLGTALLRYLALFRPEKRDLSLARVAKLVNALLPDIQAQRIMRHGKAVDAPIAVWLWAFEQAISAREQGRVVLPLKTHGWLYEVISRAPAQVKHAANTAMICSAASTTASALPQSKTLAAIAALEQRVREGAVHD